MRSGEWPEAELEPFASAIYTQTFVCHLLEAMNGAGLRETARAADLSPMTILRIIRGETFPDSVTITKLEVCYQRVLWPSDETRLRVMRELRGRTATDTNAANNESGF